MTTDFLPEEADDEDRTEDNAEVIGGLYLIHFSHPEPEQMTDLLFGMSREFLGEIVTAEIERIKEALSGLGIPIVNGYLHGAGHSTLSVPGPDLDAHAALFGPGSIACINEHLTQSGKAEGFDCAIRLGTTSTWLEFGIAPPTPEQPEVDEEDDDDDEYGDGLGGLFPELDQDTTNRLAATIAQADGFGAVVRNRELRAEFVRPYVEQALPPDTDTRFGLHSLVNAVAQTATTFWEFGFIPERAQALKAAGKSVAEIAKQLGITKARAERAVDMPAEQTLIGRMRAYSRAAG